MDVHKSIEIAAPPERVWPLLVEPTSVMRWYGTLREFRYLEDRHGPGTTLHIEEKSFGPLLKIDFEATEWLPNRSVALHMTTGSGVKAYEQRWSITPSTAGCTFTFDEHVELPFGPLGKLIGAVGQRSSEATVARMLVTLKEMAEA